MKKGAIVKVTDRARVVAKHDYKSDRTGESGGEGGESGISGEGDSNAVSGEGVGGEGDGNA